MTDAQRPLRDALRLLGAAACYTAFFALFFAPAWWTGARLAPGDGALQYLPAHALPYAPWIDEILAGYPAYGDPQFFLHYPLKWLLRDYDAFVVAAFVIAATLTFGWVRARSGSTLAAAAAGIIFAAGSFFTRHVGHASIIHAGAWLPGVLWAGDVALRRPSRGAILALAAGTWLTFTAGHPQLAVYAALTAAARGVWVAAELARARGTRTALRGMAAVAAGWLLGAAAAAATLLPLLAASAASGRASAWGYADFASFSLPLRQWGTIAFPGLFGGPTSGVGYFGAFAVTETIAFAGLGVWILALVGVRAQRRSEATFWVLVLLGAGLLITVGDHALGRFLYRVPLLGEFRAHGRAAVVALLAVALLAGEGIAHLRRGGRGIAWAAAATAIVAGLALLFTRRDPVWQAALAAQGLDAGNFVAQAAFGPLLTLAATIAAAFALRYRPGPLAAGALAIVVILDVGQFGFQAEWRSQPANAALHPAWAELTHEIRAGGGRLMPLGRVDPAAHPLLPNAT
jgi:hypothetical protein